jgi:hypothetical protein
MLDNAVLKRPGIEGKGHDSVVIERPTVADLAQSTDPTLYLTYRPGVSFAGLQDEYPNVVYARLVADEGVLFLQFHFFYVYNDWVNQHEGDWEMVQIAFPARQMKAVLAGQVEPLFVTYSQHARGVSRSWSEVEVRDETHPVVYVSLGSHANYYEHKIYYIIVGFERTGRSETRYQVETIMPGDACGRLGWLAFTGRWGKVGASRSLFSDGPVGPGHKLPWRRPLLWSKGRIADDGQSVSRLWALLDPKVLLGRDGLFR